ncbi:hypothetical protein C8F04DRAFT_1174745 [Mycena alexandri]|uniref:Uncharacterized protein n=1 Tax=Mycena alexandri TaxID=1745969 RepID=A0AAD6TE47_9AGAR|nr:hypothetical protein C8F04DRAFT_1174745 [Mycena alexandri]
MVEGECSEDGGEKSGDDEYSWSVLRMRVGKGRRERLEVNGRSASGGGGEAQELAIHGLGRRLGPEFGVQELEVGTVGARSSKRSCVGRLRRWGEAGRRGETLHWYVYSRNKDGGSGKRCGGPASKFRSRREGEGVALEVQCRESRGRPGSSAVCSYEEDEGVERAAGVARKVKVKAERRSVT